jgi:hypothetical protein
MVNVIWGSAEVENGFGAVPQLSKEESSTPSWRVMRSMWVLPGPWSCGTFWAWLYERLSQRSRISYALRCEMDGTTANET